MKNPSAPKKIIWITGLIAGLPGIIGHFATYRFLPKCAFDGVVAKYNGDKQVRHFSCRNLRDGDLRDLFSFKKSLLFFLPAFIEINCCCNPRIK